MEANIFEVFQAPSTEITSHTPRRRKEYLTKTAKTITCKE